jgi:hypothetical protein
LLTEVTGTNAGPGTALFAGTPGAEMFKEEGAVRSVCMRSLEDKNVIVLF